MGRRSPGSRARSLSTCQGLRPRRAVLTLIATVRFAFRYRDTVGARDKSFAAQWLACASPCRRFAADLAIDGDDLIRIGIPPGRSIGVILNTLLLAVIEDPGMNDPTRLLARARELAGVPS